MSELAQRAAEPLGILRNNPVFANLFGLSPLLAVSTSSTRGLGLGLATLVILFVGTSSAYYLRTVLPTRFQSPVLLILLAIYSSLLGGLLHWLWPGLAHDLGIYLPLIGCNFAVLVHLYTRPPDASLPQRLADAGLLAWGYIMALLCFSLLREFLVMGTVVAHWQLLIPGQEQGPVPVDRPGSATFAAGPAAAFILLGLTLAAANAIRSLRGSDPAQSGAGVARAERARPSGET